VHSFNILPSRIFKHPILTDFHSRSKPHFANTGKEIISITEKQMHSFAGNMLQVMNREGKKFLVMSQAAFDVLELSQIESLRKYNEFIVVAVPTIEKYGGGSVRCMMAEVFYK
jgi:hypothetical protein